MYIYIHAHVSIHMNARSLISHFSGSSGLGDAAREERSGGAETKRGACAQRVFGRSGPGRTLYAHECSHIHVILWVCTYIYIYAYTHTHTHTHLCIHIHVCIYIYTHICTYISTYIYIYTHTYTHVCTCTCTHG